MTLGHGPIMTLLMNYKRHECYSEEGLLEIPFESSQRSSKNESASSDTLIITSVVRVETSPLFQLPVWGTHRDDLGITYEIKVFLRHRDSRQKTKEMN